MSSIAYGLRGEGLVWLIGAVVCLLLAANRGSNCSLTRAMDGRIVRCGSIISCQSAATYDKFRDCKTPLVASPTHVRGAIASTRPLPLQVVQKSAVNIIQIRYIWNQSKTRMPLSIRDQ